LSSKAVTVIVTGGRVGVPCHELQAVEAGQLEVNYEHVDHSGGRQGAFRVVERLDDRTCASELPRQNVSRCFAIFDDKYLDSGRETATSTFPRHSCRSFRRRFSCRIGPSLTTCRAARSQEGRCRVQEAGGQGKDPQPTAWASQKLPTLPEHLRMAQELEGQVKAAKSSSLNR
jgi:hypothetical protein